MNVKQIGFLVLKMRLCATCKCIKTLENTNVDNGRKDKLNKYCKECLKIKRSTQEEIAKRKIKQKEYYSRNKTTILKNTREYNLKKNFDIVEEDYNAILKRQNHCCAICGKNEKEFTRRLAVDHCHTSSKIRGLLCFNCNSGLGRFKDSTKLLNEAIKYLEESKNGY